MKRKPNVLAVLVIITLLLVACGDSAREYETGEVLLTESFDEASAWETYVTDEDAFQVIDGTYRTQTGGGGYVWGLNDTEHDDVVIEVTSSQLSSYENNAYGVMCRADSSNNGDGYYFLISGDGYYAISKGEGEDVNQIVEWTSSSAINQGQANNTIRAVCIDNYLALYVNGELVADTKDNEYKSGYAGFAAAAFDGGNADISFDNLTITAASLSN